MTKLIAALLAMFGGTPSEAILEPDGFPADFNRWYLDGELIGATPPIRSPAITFVGNRFYNSTDVPEPPP